MIKEQNNIVIENSSGKLTVTTKDKSLLLEISKDVLGIPYSSSLAVSTEDAKELLKALLLHLDKE